MKLFRLAALALLLTTAYAHAVPVTLRVVDAGNQPVVGASVEYVDYARMDATTRDFPPPQSKVTAADGTLALDVEGAARARDFDVGDVTSFPNLGGARVRASGYGYALVNLVAGENLVTLQRGVSLHGIIRDETGAALTGARVVLQSVEPDAGSASDAFTGWIVAPIEALTDQNGVWKMTNLPRGNARLQVFAPDEVAGEIRVTLDQFDNAAPPLQLEPAGKVSGRILDRDGGPLAGVSVSFPNQIADSVSDETGRFVLQGVPLGETELRFFGSSANWLGVDKTVVADVPTKGAVVDVGEVRTGDGLLISGALRDKESGAPLPNLELRSVNARFTTDTGGRFAARVSGENFGGLRLPDGYTLTKPLPSPPKAARSFDLGEILLERTIDLPLDLRDEDGAPAPGAKVRFQSTNLPDVTQQRDAVFDGQSARVRALPAAEYAITGLGLWQVIEPLAVTVSASEKPAPLTIRLRQLTAPRISGRVTDQSGQPLLGARVKIGWTGDWHTMSALSGRDGTWSVELPDARATPIFGNVELPAFARLRGGELTRVGETNQWNAADIVMARTDVAFTGRVVDENGGGVARARINWGDAPKFDVIATDANGQFQIKGLPDAPIAVRASDGPRFVETTATPDAPLELRLAPITQLADSELEQLLAPANAEQLRSLVFYSDIIGESRVLEAVERFNAQGNPLEIGALDRYLEMLSYRARTPDSSEAVARQGVRLLRKFRVAEMSGAGAGRIALMAARSQDADLRAWAEQWVDAQKGQLSLQRVSAGGVGETLRVAAVGGALRRGDAFDALTIGLTQINRLPTAQYTDYFGWGALLWNGDPQWLDEAIEDWAPTEQAMAIAGALGQIRDVESGRVLLKRLQKLADATTPEEASNWLRNGEFEFVRAVAPLDANAAYEILQKQGAKRPTRALFAAAQSALASGQTQQALHIIQLEADNDEARFARVCALALLAKSAGDSQLAQQLIESARGRIEGEGDALNSQDVAAYAFALHAFDAGAGRLLLEAQWARETDESRSGTDKTQRVTDLQDLAWAMAIYDVPRALQRLNSIPNQRAPLAGRAASVRAGIFAIAFATPQQQALALERLDST